MKNLAIYAHQIIHFYVIKHVNISNGQCGDQFNNLSKCPKIYKLIISKKISDIIKIIRAECKINAELQLTLRPIIVHQFYKRLKQKPLIILAHFQSVAHFLD